MYAILFGNGAEIKHYKQTELGKKYLLPHPKLTPLVEPMCRAAQISNTSLAIVNRVEIITFITFSLQSIKQQQLTKINLFCG